MSSREGLALLATLLALAPAGAMARSPAVAADPGLSRPAPRELFALVIGCNSSNDPGVQPLRYADDDAVQNARLLSEFGARVVLLVKPDAETRRLFPEVQATEPTKAAVFAALVELNRLMDDARREGKVPILYIIYSGHGDVRNNEGYVALQDSSLRRDEFLDLLRSSRAGVNHVIVDACKSYFLVYQRGSGGARRKLTGSLMQAPRVLPANTGVFLSTSSATDSHEWEAFQGGIFSHEVRSALRGPADVNGDGLVTYEEAAAFVWTANAAIPNSRFRPLFYIQPPAATNTAGAALADLRLVKGDRLLVEAGKARRGYVEDPRGVRLVDFHVGAKQAMRLLLPVVRPMFVRQFDPVMEAEIPRGKETSLAALQLRPAQARTRGAEHVAFRRLFSLPFDASAIASYRVRPSEECDAEAGPSGRNWNWVRQGLGLTAIAAGVAGGAMTLFAYHQRSQIGPDSSALERSLVNDRIDRFNVAAITCYAVAGAAALGYLGWTFWPKRSVKIRVQPAATLQAELSVEWR